MAPAATYLASTSPAKRIFRKSMAAIRRFTSSGRACPATEILSSSHFPEEFQGNLLVGNVIGFRAFSATN